MASILFSLAFFVFRSCDDSSNQNPLITIPEPAHLINDSGDILRFDSNILRTGWYYVVTDSSDGYERQLDRSDETYYIDPKPIITAKNFTRFEIFESGLKDKKYIGLSMWLDKKGTESWAYATEKSSMTHIKLAFIVDDRLLYVAQAESEITGGVTALNRGIYTREELENFKKMIQREKCHPGPG